MKHVPSLDKDHATTWQLLHHLQESPPMEYAAYTCELPHILLLTDLWLLEPQDEILCNIINHHAKGKEKERKKNAVVGLKLT